jgi:hypothetical protein
MRRLGIALAGVLAIAPALASAQLTTPTDWKWRQDAEAPLAGGLQMKTGEWAFVQMPPGWHVTTGPGVLLYPSANGDVGGNFTIESEVFLFPGPSTEEYGLFLGGKNVEAGDPHYVAFVLRRDGQAAVLRRSGAATSTVAAWQANAAVLPGHAGEEPVKNTLRVDVEPQAAALWVNGTKVLSVPRSELSTDGRVGFRIGKEMNLHITSFNVTRRFAPVPVKK